MAGDLLVGGGMVLFAIVGLIRFLFADSGATATLKTEITGLREALAEERRLRRADMDGLSEKLNKIEALYDTQRREKHQALNDLAKAQMLLGTILVLAEKCTCGALSVVEDLLNRYVPQPQEPT